MHPTNLQLMHAFELLHEIDIAVHRQIGEGDAPLDIARRVLGTPNVRGQMIVLIQDAVREATATAPETPAAT